MEETIKRIVTRVLCNALGVNAEEITGDAHIQYDLGADGLDAVEIIMELEKEFNISIPDEDFDKLPNYTVGCVIEYLGNRLLNLV